MDNKTKVFILGIDGATFDLIKPWIAQGELPTFSYLMNNGTHGNLISVPNTNSAPAWVSFATGTNPGKHGIFYFDEPIIGTYQRRYLNGSFRKNKAIWNYVSEGGRKVNVINVPMTYPAEKLNGFMIAGLDAPGIWSKGFCYPSSLINELKPKIGEYVIEPGIPTLIKAGKRELAVKRLLESIDKRYIYTSHLIDHTEWDLFNVVFTEVDNVQHFFWKYMDPSHPEYDEKESLLFGSTIFKIYQRMDQIISLLLEKVNDSTLIILSDHGGGFNQRGAEYINIWLASLGLLAWSDTNTLGKRAVKGIDALYRLIDKTVSREIKLKLAKAFPGVRAKIEATSRFKNIDWGKTYAYSDGARDEIWINLCDREPRGIVRPGEEYEKIRNLIISELSRCVDIKNGKRVVKNTYRREDIYWGKYVLKAPDIFVDWQKDFVIHGLKNDNVDVDLSADDYQHIELPLNNGGHRKNGILLMYGPHIKKNHALEKSEIIDVAPTALYLLENPIPKDMDGRILEEAFDASYLGKSKPCYKSMNIERKFGPEEDYSQKDAETIEKRLKDLGYID